MTDEINSVLSGWRDREVLDMLSETRAIAPKVLVIPIFADVVPVAVRQQTISDLAPIPGQGASPRGVGTACRAAASTVPACCS